MKPELEDLANHGAMTGWFVKRTGLLLLLLCAQAYALNQSFCPAWKLLSPVQAKCPLFRNGTSNLEAIIEQELAGQELATRAIRKALAKMFREYDEAVLNVGVKEMVMAFPYSLDIMLTNPIAQKTVGDIGIVLRTRCATSGTDIVDAAARHETAVHAFFRPHGRGQVAVHRHYRARDVQRRQC